MVDLGSERRRYAGELARAASLRSTALIDALARVRREDYLGPAPWTIIRVPGGVRETTDPTQLYQDVLVIIDPERLLNNGQPSMVTSLIDSLDLERGDRAVHVGCGTGYYTALMAEIVGASGHVTAIEIDPDLAERARQILSDRPWVEVATADGFRHDPGEADAILVNAGVTHPSPLWLDRLAPGGRLVLPLTATARVHTGGAVVRVVRHGAGLSAAFTSPLGLFPCVGGRDAVAEALLVEALAGGRSDQVRSLRRDAHEREADCWLHGEGYCLSRRDLQPD
jgi:protein-L-isoaspartate(D-aspartate) O-methyltransferase